MGNDAERMACARISESLLHDVKYCRVEFGEKRKPECPTNEPGRRFAGGPQEERRLPWIVMMEEGWARASGAVARILG
jgi:hypothetical protein